MNGAALMIQTFVRTWLVYKDTISARQLSRLQLEMDGVKKDLRMRPLMVLIRFQRRMKNRLAKKRQERQLRASNKRATACRARHSRLRSIGLGGEHDQVIAMFGGGGHKEGGAGET